MLYCPRCGKLVGGTALFCSNCGISLKKHLQIGQSVAPPLGPSGTFFGKNEQFESTRSRAHELVIPLHKPSLGEKLSFSYPEY